MLLGFGHLKVNFKIFAVWLKRSQSLPPAVSEHAVRRVLYP